ncbi:hypothetical protein HHI36_013177 [Cryptolaemus montrouzieri]|uniref:Chitin-binding type-2 domain-containing protein n=1 Tax=Cryptolaemus montrouzieri TaxID=559131 RepID=A0ABD2NHG2_9CUCU
MGWKRSKIYLLFLWIPIILAQDGYNYSRPQKPFPSGVSSIPGKQAEKAGEYPTGPPVSSTPRPFGIQTGGSATSQSFPGYPSSRPQPALGGVPSQQSLGYPSGKPSVESSSRPIQPYAPVETYPGSGVPRYPGTGGTQYPGGVEPEYAAPGRPQYSGSGSGPQYPGTTRTQYPGESGSQYPGTTGPQYPEGTGPQYPGSTGPKYSGATGPQYPGGTGPQYPGVPTEEEETVEGDYSAIPGIPGDDYPIYSEIPETSFQCDQQQYPGYYADVETRCQVFHICANNKTYNFLCPNGTIFHQEYLVCVWWNTFDCNLASSLYNINANIYDYSIVGAPQQSTGFLGTPGVQGTGYPGGPEALPGYPNVGFPSVGGPQGPPSSQFPQGQGAQEATGPGYPEKPRAPSGPGLNYQGGGVVPGYPTGVPQTPGYPEGSQIPAYPSSEEPKPGYPSKGPQGPNSQTSQRPGGSQSYARPGSQEIGYPETRPQIISTPSGGLLDNKGSGYPTEGSRVLSYPKERLPTQFPGQQPTREYLPPTKK